MTSYYNENDPFAAQWLRNLIDEKLIPKGDVDDRSIELVQPGDLRGYRQCHFFAGIAGWPLALTLAGWPETREVWTGSCPCQPLSGAGQKRGAEDKRHLWPVFCDLIAERRPATVFGEQVASPLGREWLAGVRLDLEALGYACGAADLCAAGVGAPHIRQRLWWVADADSQGESGRRVQRSGEGAEMVPWAARERSEGLRTTGGMGDADNTGSQGRSVGPDRLTDAQRRKTAQRFVGLPSFWSGAELIPCADGKSRRIEPGTFPLAHGIPARVGKLRAYGNAIVPQVAAEFISAFRETAE